MFKAIYRGSNTNEQGFGFGRQYEFVCQPITLVKGRIFKSKEPNGFLIEIKENGVQKHYLTMSDFIADWREIEVTTY